LNTKALGYFTSVFYLVFVGSKFINAMGNAMLPRLAQLYDEGKESQFNKLLFKLIAISALIVLFLIGISCSWVEHILNVIYGPEFIEYKVLLILIMIYGTFDFISYSLITGLNAMKKFKVQPYLGTVWLLFSVLSLLYFTPKFGIVGAAISLII